MKLKKVESKSKTIDQYRSHMSEKHLEEIQNLSKELQDMKVLHLNATSYGGGVAEMLYSLVPLMNDVGIDTDWRVMNADDEFFDITKSFHNALQGENVELTEDIKQKYLETNKKNAEGLDENYDVVVLHDPQPLGMVKFLREKYPDTKFVWRCHIDLTDSNEDHQEFTKEYIRMNDAAIFSREQYNNGFFNGGSKIIHPSIDPLSEKNRDLDVDEIGDIMEKFGDEVDFEKPIVTQVSRFDPWKDPLGVITSYKKAKKEIPDLQLILIGSLADDDPEGVEVYENVCEVAKDDPDIHVLKGLSDLEVNAFQRISDVVLQKSKREGFGLTVSEALWKGTPVIGGKAGGIPLQVKDEELLVENCEECARNIVKLFREKDKIEDGSEFTNHVRENFLVTRHLLDYLKLFKDLKESE